MDSKEKRAFKIASFLLQYPNAEWYEALEEASSEVKSVSNITDKFAAFIEYAKRLSELDLAELYTSTFDFSKESSLNLTFYDYAEQQERGMALYKFKERYREAGLTLINNELPDFLPLLLEFVSLTGEKEILTEFNKALENIYDCLLRKYNPYAKIIEGILMMIRKEASDEKGRGSATEIISCKAAGGDKI